MNKLTENPIYKFSLLSAAELFVERAIKPLQIIMGDDLEYWVCYPADAERLIQAGYE